MFDWLHNFLAIRGYAPHGYCLLWQPGLIWTHVVSDAVIAAAYFSIPFVLLRLVRLRQDIEFGWMLGLFATFILACGTTHLLSIATMWIPAYGWEALVKAVTAVASIATAVLLVPLLPKLVAIPSPSALRQANEALVREAREREKTEEMLRQAQKMEAIGQLTGGIAHDFNNLLGIVIGNLDRSRRKGSGTPEGRLALDNAIEGAERAARLTDQLLAFARKQPLRPEPTDINEIVTGMSALLRQTAGALVRTEIDLQPGIPAVILDRNLMENAILNLTINARDAMAQGGVLTIKTSYLASTDEVKLCVSDTGAGMTPDVLQHATEPFFTTKAVGHGSGLGLSQVVGTIEQHGGRVEIESRPEEGTAIHMFLPVAQAVGALA
jgi:signal transduction histidine kinase